MGLWACLTWLTGQSISATYQNFNKITRLLWNQTYYAELSAIRPQAHSLWPFINQIICSTACLIGMLCFCISFNAFLQFRPFKLIVTIQHFLIPSSIIMYTKWDKHCIDATICLLFFRVVLACSKRGQTHHAINWSNIFRAVAVVLGQFVKYLQLPNYRYFSKIGIKYHTAKAS